MRSPASSASAWASASALSVTTAAGHSEQVGLRDKGVADMEAPTTTSRGTGCHASTTASPSSVLAGDMAAGLGEERLGAPSGGLIERGRAQAALDRLRGRWTAAPEPSSAVANAAG